jgi:ABC-type lipoprotein export system ATPase subunit
MDFKVKNTVYLAAAGSGKTTLLVNKACAVPSTEYVLMLTYTDSNEQEIRNKFYKENDGVIPKNVFIMSWFSFFVATSN